DQPLGAGGLAVDGERDADSVEEEVGRVPVLGDACGGRVREPFGERGVMRAHRTVRIEHLVEEGGQFHRLRRSRRLAKDSKRKTGLRREPEAGKYRAGSPRAAPPPGNR